MIFNDIYDYYLYSGLKDGCILKRPKTKNLNKFNTSVSKRVTHVYLCGFYFAKIGQLIQEDIN